MPITRIVTGFSHPACLACFAILVSGACDRGSQSSTSPIVTAIVRARENPEPNTSTRIRGVVSFVDSQSGDCVVEDATGGVRLALGQEKPPIAGDLVEAAGLLQVTSENGVMLEPRILKVGVSERPRPIHVSLRDLRGKANRTIAFRG